MEQLIAYFSRGGENYVNGVIQNLSVGNAEQIAHEMQKFIKADLFKIEPKVPYATDYNECINEAKHDRTQNLRPELIAFPDSIDHYSTIYLGYPNYWGTMPMAVFTFLEHFDFTGKIIRPFCTHEGSGLGSSIKDIKQCAPTAQIENGIAIRGNHVSNLQTVMKDWK